LALVLLGMTGSLSHQPSPRITALRQFNGFAELALMALFAAGLGVAVGVLLAIVLRHRRLAWTWSLFTLPPVVLLAGVAVLGPLGLGIGTVSVSFALGLAAGAISQAVHMRLQDRRAGGDREIAAAGHRGVFDGFRHRLADRGERGGQAVLDGLPIGRTRRGELACVPRGGAHSGSHVLIPGASGAGKTTSLAALLVEYVARSGFGAVVLEAKTDAALLEAAESAAMARGVPFRLVSPEGPNGYDPLAKGSVDERSERLVAAQTWGSEDADFYRQAASPFLRLVLRVLDLGGEPVTLARVVEHCDPDELVNVAMEGRPPPLAEEVHRAVDGFRADERRAIAGMQARLRNLASSEFARTWLDPLRPGIHTVDLRGAVERREVVYFRLDTDRTGTVGRAIAQMALLDLGAVASDLMDAGVGTFVGIDEFGALEAPALERLYTRGRAAGFSVAVGTQTLADLRAAGSAVRERIGATVSAVLCHRLGGQDDAQWVAQLIGTVPTWENTVRTDRWGMPSGEGTRTRGHRFEVNPADLQRLNRGEAYVARLDRASSSRSARVRVVPAWERLSAKGGRPMREPSGLGRRSTR
jgi:hypothetical protein